jgi:2-aminoethylphosphonate-pyruvate transaminase
MILLNPGPVNVSPRVTEALARGDICHREPEFGDLQASIRARLLQAFTPGGRFTAVLMTGSGTAAVEAAVTSVLSERGRLVVVANGVYGERIAAMAAAARLPHTVVAGAWTEPPDLDAVERAVQAEDVEAVAVVHHETTTGLRNPIAEVGRIARRHGKLLLLDAVSSLAGDPLDAEEVGADLIVGTGGKCIQAFPGLAFVLVRLSAMERLTGHPRRSLYLSLPVHHEAQERRTVAPAVQLAYALDEALAELLEEGVANRVGRYAAAAAVVRAGCERLGLRFVLPAARRSNSITSLWLPPGRSYAMLHDGLRAEGFVIYEGQGKLAREIFRVANMGALTKDDFAGFLRALETVLGA